MNEEKPTAEQQKILKRVHHWITATFVINTIIAVAALFLFIITLLACLTANEPFNIFTIIFVWIGVGALTVPAGAITSFISFLTLRKWRELELPNQKYLLARLSIGLGLVPPICILILLGIAILTHP